MAEAPAFDGALADRTAAEHAEQGAIARLLGFVAGFRGRPELRRPIVALYASSIEGIENGPTLARFRLEHLAAGGGAVSQLARSIGAGVEVFDLALDQPVKDASVQSASSAREVAATLAFGLEAVAKQPDLLVLGDLTLGSARSAATLVALRLGLSAAEAVDAEDRAFVAVALARARAASPRDVLEEMAEVGGREIAALAGAILAARVSSVPVLIDSPAALAAALMISSLAPGATAHCLMSATPDSPALRKAAQALGLTPVLGLASGSSEGVDGLQVLAMLRQLSD